ncbi:MAG: protein kinase [Deltaproteobacteria bacterium]|nr:protein kinase [Deltaproteobacteria bacterium]
MPFSPGMRLLDRYVLEEQIGHGGMALVFKAKDERSGKVVAVKQMVIDDTDSIDTFTAWFKREIKALMVLDHPGIPRLLDYSSDTTDPFVVIEYLSGFDLDQAISAHGPMPEGAAVLLSVKLLHALGAAHAQGIVHRDIKPANMFLCFNGRAVLLDFGLARSTLVQSGKTLAGTLNTKLIGTPQYFAPEQIQGGVTLSAASDMFSLGSALYFLLTGKHAFIGDNPLAVITAIGTNQRRPLAQSGHWLKKETVAFVEHLMAFEVAERPKTAHDAMTEAEELLRFFPDAESTLRRYVSALEKREKPPAPSVGATMDVAQAIAPPVKIAPAEPPPMVTVATAPSMEHDTAVTTISGERESHTVVATIAATVAATSPSTNLITSPSEGAPRRRTLQIGLAVFALVAIMIGAFWITRKSAPRPQVAQVEAPPPPVPLPPANADLPPPTETQAVSVPKPVPAVEPDDPRPKRVEAGTGTLNLQLKQWAEVVIDGKSFGRKQIMATLTLPEGAHEIELKNDRYGARQKRINVKRGQELTLQVDFVKQLP